MTNETKYFYEFGPYRIDPEERLLFCDQQPVPLPPKAFGTLLILVNRSERVVSKDDLMKSLWPDTFVEEANLSQNIFVLRKALGETAQDARYIVTVPGRGYRFAEKVIQVADRPAPEHLVVDSQSQVQMTVKTTTETSLALRAIWIAVGIVVLVGGWGGYRVWSGRQQRIKAAALPPSLPARRSIAVLGFRNSSGRSQDAWLSTAVAEMLNTELAAGEELRLVPGEDVARARHDLPLADADSLSRDTLSHLRKRLGADEIVLGSYTVIGDGPNERIRLDLRLQDAAAGETKAEVSATGNEANLFELVSQAGGLLREKLSLDAVSLADAVSIRASLPGNPEAARRYAQGLDRMRVFDALAARDLLQESVAADPKFPLAHSALAEAWSRLGYEKKAQQAARRGYELAAKLSREEKLLVEGRYRQIGHENDKAIEAYRTLFTLFPDNLDYGLKLAAAQCQGNKGRDALATVESLRKLAAPASADPRIDLAEKSAWHQLGDFKHQEQPLAQAVEKSKAQGALLILAEARREQCWLYSYFGQLQTAVGDCRESRDLSAAAGDRQGEADALRTWADAIAQSDAPEAIRLYQQAEAVFRSNGSDSGVSAVLNNLGLVYEAQGDPSAAEKMHREALAIFRRLDDKQRQAAATLNLANAVSDQGNLPGAIKLYEEALQLDQNTENSTDVALADYNIANMHALQGDLVDAKQGFEQALATWQKNGDQYSSTYATYSLGQLLLQEADFAGARKMYEQTLAARTSASDTLGVAEIRMNLAELGIEQGRSPSEQEPAIQQTIEVFEKEKARDDEIQAWCILSRYFVAEDKTAEARESAQRARGLAAKSQNPYIRWMAAIAAARIETAARDSHSTTAAVAFKELNLVITQAHKLGYKGTELEARLALGELEIKTGRAEVGRQQMAAVEKEATAAGFALIAHKAEAGRISGSER